MLVPTMNLTRYIGCPQSFDRKIALYFVAPFGVISIVLGYPHHKSEVVAAGNVAAVAIVVLAVTWGPMIAYRQLFLIMGCTSMLGCQYFGDKIGNDRVNDNSNNNNGNNCESQS